MPAQVRSLKKFPCLCRCSLLRALALAAFALLPVLSMADAGGVRLLPQPGAADFRPTPDHPIGWRGDGSGLFPGATPPLQWGFKDGQGTNIVWRTPLPGDSPSSVIVVGERLYTTINSFHLVCLDKPSGRILWLRPVDLYEAATPEERQANPEVFGQAEKLAGQREALLQEIPGCAAAEILQKGAELSRLDKAIDKLVADTDKAKYKRGEGEGGLMAATPASDGSLVYAWNASGVTACFTPDGQRKWIRFDPTRNQEHGIYGSPLLIDDKVIIQVGKRFLAFDKHTGKDVWKGELFGTPEDWRGYWYSSHIPAVIDGEKIFVAGDGSLVRAADGKCFSFGQVHQGAPSPVIGGGMVYWMDGPGSAPFHYYKLPEKTTAGFKPEVKGKALKFEGAGYFQSSPLYYDGLVYILGGTPVLFVFDPATEKMVYRQELDFGDLPEKRVDRPYGCGNCASPAMAGGKIFITGNFGATLVIEPGRTYQEIARNTIDHRINYAYKSNIREGTVGNAFFEGHHIFFRGQRYVYCIGEPGKAFITSQAK